MIATTCHAFTWRNGRKLPVAEIEGRKKRFVVIQNPPELWGGGSRWQVGQSDNGKWYRLAG